VEAKVPIPAARKSPVEDTLLPEMCNCVCCAIRVTWQSTTLETNTFGWPGDPRRTTSHNAPQTSLRAAQYSS